MACISDNKLWKIEFDKIVSSEDRVQEANNSQLKFKVNKAYRKDDKITTTIEASKGEYVINRSFLNNKTSKIESQMSYIEQRRKKSKHGKIQLTH